MDAFDKIADVMADSKEAWRTQPAFWLFEPYSVGQRSPAVLAQALKDGVDLNAPYLMQHVGPAPHAFQDGYLLSTKFFRGLMAASQDGKSLSVFLDIAIRASGKVPLSLRYPAGHDTGVPREITPANIRRFGRRRVGSPQVIDYDDSAYRDGKWDCGNVTGVGVYPSSRILEPGGSIRLASFQKIVLESWWPAFTGRRKDGLGRFLLPELIDSRRGAVAAKGHNRQDYQVFLCRDITLQLLTYESGAEKFEAIKVPTYLDEEPPNEDIVGAVVTHCTDWSLSETPIFGITYTKALLFPEVKSPDMETFHATAADCPYHTARELEKQRSILVDKPWEIGARFWGVPTEMQGKPYFNRPRLNLWLQRFKVPFKHVIFQPVQDWDGVKTNARTSRLPGLLDVPVRMVTVERDDKRATWKLYEDRKDGVGYVAASDQADGAETPEDAGDWSTCCIGRQRDPETDPTKPVLCATLRSSLPTPQFAREVMYAARYFNNAMLAPETGKGAANAAMTIVCADWPWWFLDTVEKWSTRKPKENRGFCPTQDRRDALYDTLMRDWFDQFDDDTYPEIPDEDILREAAAAIVGKTRGGTATRCDHPRDGTLDSLTSYAILHFTMQEAFYRQIKCHGGASRPVRKKTWLELAEEAQARAGEPPALAGLGESMTKLR